jgi:hypothetical protein
VISDASALGVVPEARVDEIQRFEQGADGFVLVVLVAVRRGAQTTPFSLETADHSAALAALDMRTRLRAGG